MTVLTEYQRLEATGLWRETRESQRREVLVSLGDATLMIATLSESALSHWSLPAVHRVNPGKMPALYAPDAEAQESLELTDQDMIAAIEKVRGAIERAKPRPGRLRLYLGGGLALAIAAMALFWLPDALLRQTAALLPEATRSALGRDILAEMGDLAGRPCADQAGVTALSRLGRVLFGLDAPRLVVLPGTLPATAHLPGGILVVNRALVEDFETPEVLAGYLLAEDLRRGAEDPALRLLKDAGLIATFGMLTRGQIGRDHLREHAAALLTAAPIPVPDAALLDRFAQAGVASSDYAYALDISGETTLALIEGDPLRGTARTALIRDDTWVALQQICGG